MNYKIIKIIFYKNNFIVFSALNLEKNSMISITGSIPENMILKYGDIVHVEGEMGSYKNQPQIKIRKIEKIVKKSEEMKENIDSFLSLLEESDVIGKRQLKNFIKEYDILSILTKKENEFKEEKDSETANILKKEYQLFLENGPLYKFLSKYSLFKLIDDIKKDYGSGGVFNIEKNPYLLLKYGVRFNLCDKIMEDYGEKIETSFLRTREGIKHYSSSICEASGSIGLKLEDFKKNINSKKTLVPFFDLEKGFSALVEEGFFVKKEEKYIVSIYSDMENKIASILLKKNQEIKIDFNFEEIEKQIKIAEKKFNIALSEDQKTAIVNTLIYPVSIITGGPGTGKSTIQKVVRFVSENLNKKTHNFFDELWGDNLNNINFREKGNIKFLAPTGKAAHRLASTVEIPAFTIHKFLGASFKNGGFVFSYNEKNKVEDKHVIIDEFSMVDLKLFMSLLNALNNKTKITVIGDVNQLSSIGVGDVLKDLIESKVFPTTTLNRIYRQEKNKDNIGILEFSQSIKNSNAVFKNLNEDEVQITPMFGNSDDDDKSFENILRKMIYMGYDPFYDSSIFSFMNKSDYGIEHLNSLFKDIFNPISNYDADEIIESNDCIFTTNDKIIQIVNDFDSGIMNGDIGHIVRIFTKNNDKYADLFFPEKSLLVSMKDEQLKNCVKLGYAITIHKSQGSEYPCVFYVMPNKHFFLTNKNVFYTAITRPKKTLFLLANQSTIKKSLSVNQQERYTELKNILQSNFALWRDVESKNILPPTPDLEEDNVFSRYR